MSAHVSRETWPDDRGRLPVLMAEFRACGGVCAEGTDARLAAYLDALCATRGRLHAISDGDWPRLVERHVRDCLRVLVEAPEALRAPIVDVGTGTGLPGLVLACARPDLDWTLVDSNLRKALFCRRVVGELGLPNVTVLSVRVESLASDPAHAHRYRTILARAVTDDAALSALTDGLRAPDATLITWRAEGLPKSSFSATLNGHLALS